MVVFNYLFRTKAAIPSILGMTMVLLTGCVTLPADQTENRKASSAMVFDVYRRPLNHLRAVRRGPCPMHPSCSEYARQAMAVHGRVIGWVMTMDRLMRCGRDETRLSPKIRINGQIKYFDPITNNDFWWSEKAFGF